MMDPTALIIFVLLIAGTGLFMYKRLTHKKDYQNNFKQGRGIALAREITVNGSLTRQQFIDANLQLNQKQGLDRWTIFYIILIVLLSLISNLFNRSFNAITLVSVLVGGVVIGGFILGLNKYLTAAIRKNMAAKNYDNTPFIHSEVKYTFTQNGYEQSSALSNARADWKNVYCYSETADYIFIYTSHLTALIIPKAKLSVSDYEVLHNFISINFGLLKVA